MGKIKVIDLLNKIANGEEVPKKFKYKDNIFYLQTDYYSVCYRCNENDDIFEGIFVFEMLNDEIEIIEDTPKEDKKIEKIKDKYCSQISKVELARKINEIIDKVNGESDE